MEELLDILLKQTEHIIDRVIILHPENCPSALKNPKIDFPIVVNDLIGVDRVIITSERDYDYKRFF